MKPVPFAYRRVRSVDEACAEVAQHGRDGAVLAGGQTLVAQLNRRAVRPRAVIDIGAVRELAERRTTTGGMWLGALVRHRDIEVAMHRDQGWAVLRDAVRGIGTLPVRVRGTVGGTLAHGDPAAQWCVVATALGGSVEAVGPRSARVLPVADFLLGPRATALADDELVTGLMLPGPLPAAAWAQHERPGEGPTVGACVALAAADALSDGGEPQVVLGGVADVPLRGPVGERPPEDPAGVARWLTAVADSAAEAVPVESGHDRRTVRHLRRLAGAVTRRAAAQALARRPAETVTS